MIRVSSQTQIVHGQEVSQMSGDDPEQTETPDAIKKEVGLLRNGRGGAEDTLGGSLKGEHVEEVGQKALCRALTAVVCQKMN